MQGLHFRCWIALAMILSGAPYARAQSRPASPVPPVSAEDSLKLMHGRDGFQVELVAAEPLVMDPVAIAWGADGKLWIVEMADYPSGIDGKMKSGGRVRYLESTHHDGHYDKSTLFLDGINFPTGIIPWRKGVIITAAPEIFYAQDTDGDGKADKRVTLYTGFKEGNAQLRVNGLRWGLDGWLYCANGWSGGIARSERTGQSVNLSGHDFRIKPDQGLIELQSGMSEFGRDCDDDGNWFGCDNSNPLFHFPFDDRYLRRNPAVPAPASKIQLAIPVNPKLYAASKPQKRFHSFEHVDHFTSACGMTIYRDDLLFGRDGTEHAFICEPVHNLVHHLVLKPSGASFTAARAAEEQQSEFLASEDQWCRPVMARTGPDGALWVVDMYRYIIEHPDWLPPQGQKELAAYWRLGEDRGRIYRIVPKGKSARAAPTLATRSTTALVAALDSSNAWQRETAQQLLVWRQDPSSVPACEQLLTTCKNPLARLQALCTLDLLGGLKASVIETALHDSSPGVRRQALRLAEPRAIASPTLIEAAAKLVSDNDPAVRLQLACTLGEWDDARAGDALGKMAVNDANDPLIVGAIMSSAARHYRAITHAIATTGRQPSSSRLIIDLLATALAAKDRTAVAELLEPVAREQNGAYAGWQLETYGEFLDLLAQRGTSEAALEKVTDSLSSELRKSQDLLRFAHDVLSQPHVQASELASALKLLGRRPVDSDSDARICAGFLKPQIPDSVQFAAISAMRRTGSAGVPELLLTGWQNHSPEVRQAILDVLLSRQAWTLDLLKAIQPGRLSAADLDVAHRHRLLQSKSDEVLELARKVLGPAPSSDRQKAVDSYSAALTLAGDVKRGADVFRKNCATCHRLNDIGNEIGPNLRSVSSWTPQMMLVAILDPNRQVEPRYLSFTVMLDNGEGLFGVIADESTGSLTIKTIDGQQRTILRSAIRSLVCTNRSLMPEGLEAAMSMQDVADVMAFVQKAE